MHKYPLCTYANRLLMHEVMLRGGNGESQGVAYKQCAECRQWINTARGGYVEVEVRDNLYHVHRHICIGRFAMKYLSGDEEVDHEDRQD